MSANNKTEKKESEKLLIIREKGAPLKSKLLKATMAKTTCCRGERA